MPIFKKNTATYTDEELLSAYLETAETNYFGELYNRYIPLLYGLCLKYLQNEEKAQDAVMQIFEDLLPKINRYEIKVFKTWLYSVAKNYCLQQLRKEEKEITVDFNTQFVEFEDIMHLFDNDDKEENANRLTALKKCLEKLPEIQRTTICKFFMEEMSYMDIADVTGFQLKSVKSYIQNGKRNLKICIEKEISY
ncbi:MAG: sigma-70 family RNA polymerase sigma factor [Candidatus Azobacteroides sp.]|nr:sigma-70 family RNA polymerase sigma factor [Candidatus Azobacteroides sp.]